MSEVILILLEANHARVLAQREGTYCAEVVTWVESEAVEVRAGKVKEALVAKGYVDQPMVLAVPSSMCLCAKVDTSGLPRSGRRQAMVYGLEEHLPVSAEEVVVDFVEIDETQALGVACETVTLQPMIEALEKAGVSVRHVVPMTLLAAGHVLEEHPQLTGLLMATPANNDDERTDGGNGATPIQSDHNQVGYDWLSLREGRVVAWSWLATDHAAAKACVEQAMRDEEAKTSTDKQPVVVLLGPVNKSWLEGIGSPTVSQRQRILDLSATGLMDAACLQAEKIINGSVQPIIDLRRDALAAPDHQGAYQRSWMMLAAAAMVLLVSVSVVMQWRGRLYQGQVRESLQAQAEVFKEALPGQRVPVGNIRGRLVSEQRKLAGLSGQAETGLQEGAVDHALVHWQQVLGSVPRDLRVRVLEMSIESGVVRLDGEARSHSDAERLATVIRQTGWYEVEPPRTQVLREQGVGFSFTAKPKVSVAVRERGER